MAIIYYNTSESCMLQLGGRQESFSSPFFPFHFQVLVEGIDFILLMQDICTASNDLMLCSFLLFSST